MGGQIDSINKIGILQSKVSSCVRGHSYYCQNENMNKYRKSLKTPKGVIINRKSQDKQYNGRMERSCEQISVYNTPQSQTTKDWATSKKMEIYTTCTLKYQHVNIYS